MILKQFVSPLFYYVEFIGRKRTATRTDYPPGKLSSG
jgi:hypothetical protein